MVLFRMVSLVKNEQVDFIHGDESLHQTLTQDFCCAHDDHVVREVLSPGFSRPHVNAHFSAVPLDFLIQVSLKDSELLENQSDTIDLCEN